MHAGTPDVQALDTAAYLGLAKAGLEAQLASAGAELKDAQVGTYKNEKTGDEFAYMDVRLEMQGALMHEELACLKAGDYFMTISTTAQDKAELEKVLKNFALIE